MAQGYEKDIEPLPDVPFAMSDYGDWIIEDFRVGRPLVVEDTTTDLRFGIAEREANLSLHIAAVAALPLVKNGELVAMLTVQSACPRSWAPEELTIVGDTAERTWAAVERARAEAALSSSEEKYRSLFQTMGQGYTLAEIVRDANGLAIDLRMIELNPAYERLMGVSAQEARGRCVYELFPEVDPWWLQTYDRIAQSGRSERVDNSIGDGGDWFEAWVYPRSKDIIEVLFEDMTDRKRAETALRESEDRQAFLLKLSDALRPLEDAAEIERTAVDLLGAELHASQVFYATIAFDGESWSVQHDYVEGMPSATGLHPFTDFHRKRLTGWQEGRMSSVADSETEPTFSTGDRAAYAALGARAAIGVPLVRAGRFVASLAVNQAKPRDWTESELFLVRETAERTWLAIERARAETALRESEERLAAAFESVPIGVAVIDASGGAVLANAEYRRFLPSGLIASRDAGRAARWSAWNLEGHPLEPQDFPSARALRGDTVVPGQEMLYTGEDGQHIWTNVASVPVRGAGGQITGAVTAISDIDLAKRSSEALRESEERFRQFGEASQDVLWIRNAETLQWEYLTPAFETIYGLDREAALRGDNMASWVDLIVSEDRNHALASLERVRDGEWVTFEYRVRRPVDGELRWLRNTDFPIRDSSGQVAHIGGIGHDVTALKHADMALAAAELRQRTLVEGIPNLVWRAVDGGEWTGASPQWADYTGQSDAESHGWGWLNMVHPDDRTAAREAWGRALTSGGFEVEYRLCHAGERRYRWFKTRATPVRDSDGKIAEWLGTSTDIDDLRELQARQGVLVAELQHRTRNLITVVRAVSRQTLREAASLDDFGDRFGDRLSALSRVQGLLSHLSAGRRVSFEELLGSELSALGVPSEKVTLDGPADVPLRSATVQTFSLALHELATNALKYGALASSGGHLTVHWQVTVADDGQTRLQVDWRETGVDMTHVGERPQGGGYGRELIERALPYQLQAETTYELTADGVHCTIDVPVSATTA